MKEKITALVTQWGNPQRPFKAEIIIDGYSVEKSFHATRQDAFVWAEEAKKRKLEELKRE